MTRALGVTWALLAGCEPIAPLDTAAPVEPGSMLTTVTSAENANEDGTVLVTVDVDDATTAFLVTATGSDTARLALEEIRDPSGKVVLDANDWGFGPNTLTDAFFPTGPQTVSQWPIRPEDGPLSPGKWKVEFSSTDDGGPVDVTTLSKADFDFSTGVVDAQIVWAQGVDQEPGVQEAVEVAVERWRAIWADIGITLRESYRKSDIDPDLDLYPLGSAGVLASAENGTGHSVQVIIGELVSGQNFLYGVAAGIPGTVVPSEETFVLVSWLTHAGFDGTFDNYEEKRILGETLAHEIGHFMGLAHPVEQGWGQHDALGDTDECSSMSSCQTLLGSNLMFPYPVCTGYPATDCTPQGDLSGDQLGVLNRYTATL